MTTESHALAAIVRHLEKLKKNGEPLHWRKVFGGTAAGINGEPDLDICYHGRTIKLEVKGPDGKATKIQLHRLSQWKAAGAVVGVVYGVEGVVEALNEAQRNKIMCESLAW